MSSADARFAATRTRSPRSVRWWMAALVGAVALVALVVTLQRSHVDGYGPAEHQDAKARAATAARQLGTTCAGWPLDVMPSAPLPEAAGAVMFWGTRDAFRLKNSGSDEVEVEVEVADGTVRVRDGAGTSDGDRMVRFRLAPGADASFTASCASRAMTATVTDPPGVGFTIASGSAQSPLELVKRRSAEQPA